MDPSNKKNGVNDLDDKLKDLATINDIKTLEEQLTSAPPTDLIYFTAQCTSTFRHTEQTVIFSKIIAGSPVAFERSVFTAKVRGIYHFAFSNAHGGHVPHIQIMHNDRAVCNAYSNESSHWETISCSATLMLDVNDTVYVKLLSGKVLCSSSTPYAIFNGFLITRA